MTRGLIKINKTISAVFGLVIFLVLGLTFASHQAGRLQQNSDTRANAVKKAVLSASYQKTGYILTINNTRVYVASDKTADERISTEVTISNITDTVLQISPGLQMTLTDNTGHIHSATATYLAAGEIVGGPIKPGAISRFVVDFDIPASATARTFIFQKDAASEATVITL